MKYFQCTMSQGSKRHIAWLPDKFAKVGKSVRINDLDGNWLVDQVSTEGLTEEQKRKSIDLNRGYDNNI